MKGAITRLAYCQYLLISQINYMLFKIRRGKRITPLPDFEHCVQPIGLPAV